MSRTNISLPQLRPFGGTSRRDVWWLPPAAIMIGLTLFIVYTTWAAFQGRNYFFDGGGAHYLSPFYSPLFYGQPNEPRVFDATQPSWWPAWLYFSPALLILAGPGGFRFTCYYYRGAYYKAFWADPPSCAVGEPGFRQTNYRGEQSFPLVFQNIHRYFFYVAALFVLLLLWDAWRAMWFSGADHTSHFGIGLGTIVLLVNAILLGCYTFGCHCARHLSGGGLDDHSGRPIRAVLYRAVSALNRRHMAFAWASLVWVLLTDVVVRLMCMGVLSDFRLI